LKDHHEDQTIIVASLLSALTLPVFAQTGATAPPAATTPTATGRQAAKTEAAPKAKTEHAKHKKAEKKSEAKTEGKTEKKAERRTPPAPKPSRPPMPPRPSNWTHAP
jgi:hypothetical protein